MTDPEFLEKRARIREMSPARAAIYFLRHSAVLDSRRMPRRFRWLSSALFGSALIIFLTLPYPDDPTWSRSMATTMAGYLLVFCTLTAATSLYTSRHARSDAAFRAWLFADFYFALAAGGLALPALWQLESRLVGGLVPAFLAAPIAIGLWVAGVACGWIGLFVQRSSDAKKQATAADEVAAGRA